MGSYVNFQPKSARPAVVENVMHLAKEGMILAILMALTAGVFFVVTSRLSPDQSAQKREAIQVQAATTNP